MLRLGICLTLAAIAWAGGPENVLVVVNDRAPVSRSIGEYYALKRHVPAANLCHIRASVEEEIDRREYDGAVALPIATFLRAQRLTETVLYIVTTKGVPLKIRGTSGYSADAAAVDSELAMLYGDMRGARHALAGFRANPFFGKTWARFAHPDFPIYLVTRLTGYDFEDVKKSIDRALQARNTGKFVFDLRARDDTGGNAWLLAAAHSLPAGRVVLDESAKVLTGEKNVIGFASWGSNDRDRKQRYVGFAWLPGAIMTEYVSTNARTFIRPRETATLGSWGDKSTYFGGSPQTLIADYIHEGVTGAAGHVYEPYLGLNPRPDYLFEAYFKGRNLAESYYLAIPGLSWMNVVVGDPLCAIGKAK